MGSFHQTSRGWLARRLKGKEWLFLGLFLLFYLGLNVYGLKPLKEKPTIRAAFTQPETTPLSHSQPEETDTFMGLP
ncbi:MAG: hypothetical protein AAF804_11825 [Bacteroidota bacterium]